MSKIPPKKPQLKEREILALLKNRGIIMFNHPVLLLGIRGYYKNSMGEVGKNDRGIYDDALIWVIRDKGVMAFNGNCDPSKYRKGFLFGVEKGMASLNEGIWKYQTGIHNGKIPHAAFRQYDKVKVTRDGNKGDYQDEGFFGINIHRGGANGTSSLGCQTVPPDQWNAFKELGYLAIKEANINHFSYVLISV